LNTPTDLLLMKSTEVVFAMPVENHSSSNTVRRGF
jgi:hypothetical protein